MSINITVKFPDNYGHAPVQVVLREYTRGEKRRMEERLRAIADERRGLATELEGLKDGPRADRLVADLALLDRQADDELTAFFEGVLESIDGETAYDDLTDIIYQEVMAEVMDFILNHAGDRLRRQRLRRERGDSGSASTGKRRPKRSRS